ncbi:hypothetical protein ACIP5T_11030 [Microbacterium sp. NPDC088619]|uniref:hypothetical protein n=1 Tax=Microbacterium sp. NPDC088619 TaxID=3364196 RepID=UPI00382C728A
MSERGVRVRISAPPVKAGIIVAAIILLPMVGIVLLAMNVYWGVAWTILAVAALVVFTARVFRGEGESAAPRPWWQMTATRASSGLLSIMFLVQAGCTFFGFWAPLLVFPAKISAVVLLAIGVAYGHSASRLRPISRATDVA